MPDDRHARRLILAAGKACDPQPALRARAMLEEIASAWETIGQGRQGLAMHRGVRVGRGDQPDAEGGRGGGHHAPASQRRGLSTRMASSVSGATPARQRRGRIVRKTWA